MSAAGADDPRVNAAVAEFLMAQDAGTPIDPETWPDRHPTEIRPALREFLAGLGLLPTLPGRAAASTQQIPDVLPSFDRYSNLELLGSGGMGAVYRADDGVLGREVAIKIQHAHLAIDPDQADRFLAEARVASQLQHPNVAPVYEYGVLPGDPPRPYFTMKRVVGCALVDAAATHHRQPTLAGRNELLRRFIAVCGAVAFAHSRGVLHRDLKPHNVMIGDYGEVLVMDWGLARAARNAEPGLRNEAAGLGRESRPPQATRTGSVLGTLAYMAPEQARGERVGLPADVFGLGAVLCHLLTDRPVYAGASISAVWAAARECDTGPAFDRLANAQVPSELVAVVQRCLSAKPEERCSAEDAAAAVEEYLMSAEKRAREAEADLAWAVERAAADRKRRRWQLATVAGVLLLAFSGTAFGIWYQFDRESRQQENRRTAERAEQQEHSLKVERLARGVAETERVRAESEKARANDEWHRAETEAGKAETARKKAETERINAVAARKREEEAHAGTRVARDALARAQEELARIAYGRNMQVAYQEARSGNIVGARARLASTRPELRGWEWNYVHRLCYPDLITFSGHEASVKSAAFNPDGTRVVTASADRTARVWDAATGRVLLTITGHTSGVQSAAFSPDGSKIVTGSDDRTARIWDAASGEQLLVLKGHRGGVASAAFNPDGSMVVTASDDSTARIWDAATGATLDVLEGHQVAVTSAAFSPDGSKVVTGSADTTAMVWDAATGKQEVAIRGHTNEVNAVAFSPDGSKVVTASADTTARVWDARTGSELSLLKGHTGRVGSAAFSPDGTRVVTGSDDGTARVWEIPSAVTVFAFRQGPGFPEGVSMVADVAFSPDGTRVVTACFDGKASVWGATSDQDVTVVQTADRTGLAADLQAAFSTDGTKILIAGWGGLTKVHDTTTGELLFSIEGSPGPATAAFSRDGSVLVIGGADRVIRLCDAGTGRELASGKAESEVRDVAVSPDGSTVISGHGDGTARLWVRQGLNLVERFTLRGHHREVRCVAFSPDGALVATGSDDATAQLWDAQTGRPRWLLKGHTDNVRGVAFNLEGSRVITASHDHTARVWDVATGKELLVLKGHTGKVGSAAFSPGGTRLVTGGYDATARIWDAETGAELLVLPTAHTIVVNSVAFSPDDARLLTAGGTARLRDSAPVNRQFRPDNLAPPPRRVWRPGR